MAARPRPGHGRRLQHLDRGATRAAHRGAGGGYGPCPRPSMKLPLLTGLHRAASTLAAAALVTNAGSAQSDLTAYGCDPALEGSLELIAGSVSLGASLTLGVDNPLSTQPPGMLAFLAVASSPAPGFPCGQTLPGFGMAGPYGPGELLISLSPPNPLAVVGPSAWAGTGQPAPIGLAVPQQPSLLERREDREDAARVLPAEAAARDDDVDRVLRAQAQRARAVECAALRARRAARSDERERGTERESARASHSTARAPRDPRRGPRRAGRSCWRRRA